jgi:hypothetical protein
MTPVEEVNIVDTLHNWCLQCVESSIYPILLIGMPEQGKGQNFKIWRAADYPPGHLKKVLQVLADSTPEDA